MASNTNTEENMKVLNLYPIDYPFETLNDRVRDGKLILDPDFQRKYKWDKDGEGRSSKFIESCLMRIPLPACYFAEREDGSHEVIDGVQRITTIRRFFKDEFALEGLTVYPELNNKKFSELGTYKADLENTTIRCVVLRKNNPKGLVNEIFARLNQGAVKLSDQEIRHAIYPGSFNSLLKELANQSLPAFQLAKDKDDRRDEELVLRYFALQKDLKTYNSNYAKWLDQCMAENQNLSAAKIEELKQLFTETLDTCIQVFKKPFMDVTKEKPRHSNAHYDLIMWSLTGKRDWALAHKEEIQEKFNQLCQMPKFQQKLSGGLQQKSSILKRRELWISKLEEIDGYE